jgi:L-fucose isomerase-like protein
MREFRQVLVPVDLATAYETMDSLDANDPRVVEIAKDIRGGVDCIIEETEGSIINQARLELTLKILKEKFHCDVIASSCWETLQHKYNIAACSTFSRLNNQGIITACEVDVMGALTMLIMNSCALGQIPSDFIDWTDLHPTEDNVWLAWHCGNAACQLCASNCKTTLRMNERLGLWSPTCYGTLEFRMKDGDVTCARLMEYDGQFNMFYGNGTAVDIGPMTRGSYAWIKVNDIKDWEVKMIETGTVHHGVLIHDKKVADALGMFCKFMNINGVKGA